ncbi:MAG TPA: hypothetical protein VEX13_16240 [Chloroflexia bacterium]|nr:hypothetical protein [Chloroflexia bacterium]
MAHNDDGPTPNGGDDGNGGEPSSPIPTPAGGISEPITGLLDILYGQSTQDPDCAAPTFGDFVMLWGYLYKDPCDCTGEQDTWRLYLSLDFKEYIEFNHRSFAKQIDLFTDAQPLAGSLVWIRRSATVRRVREERAEDEADFLQGAISRGFLGGASGPSSILGLGLNALSRKSADPGSGGGCGTGGAFSSCE